MFRPLGNYVLLSRIEEENKTAGGIIIPDNAKEKPSRGKIVSVGRGDHFNNGELKSPEVKIGDVVLFAKWAPSVSEIKIGGKDFIIIKENDILGILE